ncbi:MAG: hypothetical protein WCF81_17790 [Roseiarcus sp.]
MTATEHANLRARYGRTRHPDDVKRITEFEKALDHLDRAPKLGLDFRTRVADRSIVDRATAAAKSA